MSTRHYVDNDGDIGSVVDAMLLTNVNGDGWPDIVTGEHRGGLNMVVRENAGGGSSWVSRTVLQGRESRLSARDRRRWRWRTGHREHRLGQPAVRPPVA